MIKLTRAAEETLGRSDYDVRQLDKIIQQHPDAVNHDSLVRIRDELAQQQLPDSPQGQQLVDENSTDAFQDRQQQLLQNDIDRLGLVSASAYVGADDAAILVDRHDRHNDTTWSEKYEFQRISRDGSAISALSQGTSGLPSSPGSEQANQAVSGQLQIEPYTGPDPYERQTMPRRFAPGDFISIPPVERPKAFIGLDGQLFMTPQQPTPWLKPW